jgi:hypothetical protein
LIAVQTIYPDSHSPSLGGLGFTILLATQLIADVLAAEFRVRTPAAADQVNCPGFDEG